MSTDFELIEVQDGPLLAADKQRCLLALLVHDRRQGPSIKQYIVEVRLDTDTAKLTRVVVPHNGRGRAPDAQELAFLEGIDFNQTEAIQAIRKQAGRA